MSRPSRAVNRPSAAATRAPAPAAGPSPRANRSSGPVGRPARGGEGPIAARALLLGVAFGVVLVKAEVISWFRIQEMFRFQAFHMYGIIGSAVLVGAVSMALIRRLGAPGPHGGGVDVTPKESRGLNRHYWLGGTLFGLGWALTGACPGPIYALIGSGATVFAVVLASALAGTWTYAALRPRLPHF